MNPFSIYARLLSPQSFSLTVCRYAQARLWIHQSLRP